MPNLIEFVGVPAAGKTTLAEDLADRLRDGGFKVSLCSRQGINFATPSEDNLSIWSMLGDALRNTRYYLCVAMLSLSAKPLRLQNCRRTFKYLKLSYCNRQRLSRLPSDVEFAIQDTGVFCHLKFTLIRNSSLPPSSLLQKLVAAEMTLLPRYLVFVRVDAATSVERKFRREPHLVEQVADTNESHDSHLQRHRHDVAFFKALGKVARSVDVGSVVVVDTSSGSSVDKTEKIMRSLGATFQAASNNTS